MVGGACYRLGEGAGLEKCLRKKTRNFHQFLQGPVTFRDKERKESYNGEDFPGNLSQKIFQNSIRLKEILTGEGEDTLSVPRFSESS